MTYGQMGRRTVLTGGASLMGLLLAGCATSSGPSQVTAAAVAAPTGAQSPVPPETALMYAAVFDDTYPIRASRMELVPEQFWRQEVSNPTGEEAGTVIVDTQNRFLYHVRDGGMATRYGVGIGAAGFEWAGRAHIAYKREWPRWTPPSDMIKRHPELERYRHGMEPGPDNPLGPRALYIHQGNTDTLYRIHGNSDETTIGKAVSSGCVRMLPQDIIHLHDNVRSGSPLLVI
ncbi:L,D-transpeptidase [Devosia naphthalenivorans]|uniref:L,D-transpeptidase n=1 Tax=Devosia naphthalenivorans TaxID=2082392 RepID=UPI000D3695EE|nr:L,D-transpeptidase [Devosia naphthalenivorans]